MRPTRLFCLVAALCMVHICTLAQTVTGKVTDNADAPIPNASVQIKGTGNGTVTNDKGEFTIAAQTGNTLVISFVGFEPKETVITDAATALLIKLEPLPSGNLENLVVIGYGTSRKKDLTGAVSSVQAKDFNKGVLTAPDQLIQGKVAGVQMINNSGQPGGATTVRIRGNSALTGSGQPLYIVDGVALDGRSSRPGVDASNLGATPGGNPLNFINPADIETIDILKDASATAIYGSRAAFGVVLITTKKGKSGALKVDVNASAGISHLMRKIDVLDGNEYRQALATYGITSGDYGSNVDALKEITRTAFNQNYNVSLSGGMQDNRYRVSLGYQEQNGIVRKSDFKKYSAGYSGNFKMLASKNLGLDINLITSQYIENIAPVSNNAGFQGSIIGQALSWNPTQSLKNPDGSPFVEAGSTIINPLAMSEAYFDNAKNSNILASISPYYRIAKGLEYRMLLSLNYSTGVRRTSIKNWINLQGVAEDAGAGFAGGWANYANNELTTQQITHTLNYNTAIAKNLSLAALVGYEYMKFSNKGVSNGSAGFGDVPLDYTNLLQYGPQTRRTVSSFADPETNLQSFFGRASFNYQDRYLLTGTLRADGTSKFGTNNRYGYFPSFAAAWNISNEGFFAPSPVISLLKLRVGWGITGNQDFPAGSSKTRYAFSGPGALGIVNGPNEDLKWQSDAQTNAGIDFSLFNSRISGSVDYFHKVTTDLLYPTIPSYPVAPGPSIVVWKNLPGEITNKGVEIALSGAIIKKGDLQWDLSVNATFLKNKVAKMPGIINTGSLNGQGLSGVNIEVIQNGLPMNAMVTRRFLGLDANGFSVYQDDGFTNYYVGNPNPSALLGISTSVSYKKISLTANLNGTFGQDVYNNTLNASLAISNLGNRNVGSFFFENPGAKGESTANPIAASSRFIEKADYLRLANATVNYRVGDIGRSLKNLNVFFTGQNLFILTGFKGFDPEVNVDKSINGVPSAGIEYTPYPTARSFNLGLNFSL